MVRVSGPQELAAVVARLCRDAVSDYMYAVRRLASSPAFAGAAVASLALGLGVATAYYSLILALFWHPSALGQPERVVVVTAREADGSERWNEVVSQHDFDVLRQRVSLAADVSASQRVGTTLADGVSEWGFTANAVTPNYFSVARLPLHLGRGIAVADGERDNVPVVVLSYGFWRSRLNSRHSVLGTVVYINGDAHVVVGVAGASVRNTPDFYGQVGIGEADGWIVREDSSASDEVRMEGLEDGGIEGPVKVAASAERLTVLVRLRPDAEVPAVVAELAGIGESLDQSSPQATGPASDQRGRRIWSGITAAAVAEAQSFPGTASVLLIGAFVVFVVASTNIANLTISRGIGRVPELAVRRALGASRGRLVREQCAESMLIACLGTPLAGIVCVFMLRALSVEVPLTNFRSVTLQPALNGEVMAAAGVSLLVGLFVFGVAPALRLARVGDHTRYGSTGAGTVTGRWRGRRILIGGQVAASILFLSLLVASARAAASSADHDPGFDMQKLALAFVGLGKLSEDAERTNQVVVDLARAAYELPTTEAAAVAAALPVGGGVRLRQIGRLARVSDPGDAISAVAVPATGGIFRTLGVSLRAGHGFGADGVDGTGGSAVVSERAAVQLFGTSEVIGRQLLYHGAGETEAEVVTIADVAEDTDTLELYDRRLGVIYVPLERRTPRSLIVVVRAADEPQAVLGALRGLSRRAGPAVAIDAVATAPDAMTPGYATLGQIARLAGILAFVTVALALCGLYGVLASRVKLQRREIGVQMALGASPERVRRFVVLQGLGSVGIGLAVGWLSGLAALMLLRSSQVQWSDLSSGIVALVASSALLVAAAGAVLYLPAHRASMVDPAIVLREK